MTNTNNAPSSSVESWQTEHLRLTLFPSPSAHVSSEYWWNELIGEPPESQVSQPRLGIRHEKGSFADGQLTLAVQPTRIDWRYEQRIPASLLQESVPTLIEFEAPTTLGSLDESTKSFCTVLTRWFDSELCPPAQRIAFGAALICEVNSREAGYRLLSKYLHSVTIEPETSRDLLYQINRPRTARFAPNIEINRLSKWTVLLRQLRLQIAGESQITSRPMGMISRLELDINTDKEFQGELEKEQLKDAFAELIELAQEIAEVGDKP